MKPLAVKPN